MQTQDAGHQYIRIHCTSCGGSFDVPKSCGNRFCSICSISRLSRIRRKLVSIVSQIPPTDGYKLRFLTLTIPRQSDIRNASQQLVSSFRRLRQRDRWRRKVRGGAYVLEYTGQPGSWHLHLHAIVDCRFYDVFQLSKDWRKCSPGHIVYLTNKPFKVIVNYITKYLTKTSIDPEHQKAASYSLRNIRLFQCFGTFHEYERIAPKSRFECPHCGASAFIADLHFIKEFQQMTSRSPYMGDLKPP